jgi:hypothetical protein
MIVPLLLLFGLFAALGPRAGNAGRLARLLAIVFWMLAWCGGAFWIATRPFWRIRQ